MFGIVTVDKVFGKSWFAGFDREGSPTYITAFVGKFCKAYKTEKRAQGQLDRILAFDAKCGIDCRDTYSIETIIEKNESNGCQLLGIGGHGICSASE